MDSADTDDSLPEILRQIQSRTLGTTLPCSTLDKTEKTAARASSSSRVRSTRPGDYITDEENLMKALARRSHNVAIQDCDLFLGHDAASIDFGSDQEEVAPGAYSGGPGAEYNRVDPRPLPEYLARDSKNRKEMCESYVQAKFNRSRLSLTETSVATTDSPTVEEADRPVQDASYGPFELTALEIGRDKKRCKWVLFFVGVVFLLLAATLPTVILLVMKQEPHPNSSQSQDFDAHRSKPPKEYPVVPNVTQYPDYILEDPHSYITLAYDWIESDPNWDTYEPWRKQQRFALACFHYSLFGLAWDQGLYPQISRDHVYWMSYSVDECEWQGGSTYEVCTVDGHIKSLVLRGPRLTGEVPPEVGFLSHLEVLDLSGFKIAADMDTLLPLKVSNPLPSLKVLNLTECELSGAIPSTLAHLTTLAKLDLSRNSLSFTIPSELGLLSDLSWLELSWNELTGSIPEELGGLTSLTRLTVDHNNDMEEIIPQEFCGDDHIAMETFITDWCRSKTQCCSS